MEITAISLYDEIDLRMKELKPDLAFDDLHKAMLMECCETIITPENIEKCSIEILMISTLQALEVSKSLMQGLIKGGLAHADVVNLNYRDLKLTFDKHSKFLISNN